jgi:hypothetical protein
MGYRSGLSNGSGLWAMWAEIYAMGYGYDKHLSCHTIIMSQGYDLRQNFHVGQLRIGSSLPGMQLQHLGRRLSYLELPLSPFV